MRRPTSPSYVLNGLYYQGGYGNYSWGSYNAIVDALEGTGTRLATESELISLFEHFNIPIGGNSDDVDAYTDFEQYFDITIGLPYGPGYIDIIDGIYQKEDNAYNAPLATVYYNPVSYIWSSFNQSGFSDDWLLTLQRNLV